MKKSILIITVFCFTVIVLTACGGSTAGSTSESPAPEETIAEETSGEAVTAAVTYDVGDFTVDLPSGWKAFPQPDLFGETDAEGNYPIDSSFIYISRDAEDEWDLFSKPYLKIKYYAPKTDVTNFRDWYENVEVFSMIIQGVECRDSFTGTQANIENFRDEFLYVVFADGQFTIEYPVEIDGEKTGLSHEDPEVINILNSITVK